MDIDVKRTGQMVLGEVLSRWAKIAPDREAIVFEARRLTYREFEDRANRLAAALAERGIRRGDRVGVLMTNCHQGG